MKKSEPNITIPVDLTNPGQFFACCGLLELADRLWPGVEAWFDERAFVVTAGGNGRTLGELLGAARSAVFAVGDDADSEAEDGDSDRDHLPVEPIDLKLANGLPALRLDWWEDRAIKPWAGSMNDRVILRAMLDAIDITKTDPFGDLRAVMYKSPSKKKAAKKEPFYFDSRRGNGSHPLDSGFSPDKHHMQTVCCPFLEALCFIGLQRARPASTGVTNQSRYTAWAIPISANLMGAVVPGLVKLSNYRIYTFGNIFRSDQRKHKCFSRAFVERSCL